MDHPLRILVTGATGAVGPRVAESFAEAGYGIRVFARHLPPPGLLPEGVETRIGDITDRSAVYAAMEGVDAVVHLAALLHVMNPPQSLRPEYERINIGGTAAVVEAAERARVGRVVLFSTISVYGDSKGAVLTEDSPPCPDSFYAQTKLAAERIALNAKRADGRPLGTVLRLGAVYGGRVRGNYRRLLIALSKGRFAPIGAGTNRRTLVYDKDAGRAAVLAASHPEAAGRIFNVTDGEIHTMNTLIATLCAALGRRPPGLTLPANIVRGSVGILEDAFRLCGLPSPVARATIDKYTEDSAVDGRRFREELGFLPRYDLASGWQKTVAEMKESGDL